MTTVESARPEDADAVRAVHRAAFPTADEAALVDRLRASDAFVPTLSLVARDDAVAGRDGPVVGHVLCSRVGVPADPTRAALVLAPLAVEPARQGAGVGSRLVRTALERAAADGWDAVFLHGSPAFYGRFGFRPAGEAGFENPFDTPPAEFMLARLSEAPMPGGRLDYPDAFDAL